MICYHDKIEKKDLGNGVLFQNLGKGKKINVWHWDMEDGSEVKTHQHPAEQFGYVIKGGFKITIGDDSCEIKAGDAYFIPANTPHSFIAVGETEAIDAFSPARNDLPG
ncbi:MAG: cupin domain-containing protein [bacterium]|nr:cupin domain-containing protein [bacterium]